LTVKDLYLATESERCLYYSKPPHKYVRY